MTRGNSCAQKDQRCKRACDLAVAVLEGVNLREAMVQPCGAHLRGELGLPCAIPLDQPTGAGDTSEGDAGNGDSGDGAAGDTPTQQDQQLRP
jgi:hypothetical protein